MRVFLIIGLAALSIGCNNRKNQADFGKNAISEAATPEDLGKELFEGRGNCYACHKPDQKIIAPSIIEIASIYKKNNGDMVSFLKGNAEPIVDPSQYEVMKTNFSITKTMSQEELEALTAYMYSFLEKPQAQ
jgi:cytochrome c